MFLMEIVDHAWPIQTHGDKDEKKNSKTKPKLTHKTDILVRARFFFLVPSYVFGTALTCVILVPSSCSALNSRRVACRVDSMLH